MIHVLERKDGQNILQSNGTRKQACITVLMADKIGFNIKLIRRDKEGHVILIKETLNQEDITILNIRTKLVHPIS